MVQEIKFFRIVGLFLLSIFLFTGCFDNEPDIPPSTLFPTSVNQTDSSSNAGNTNNSANNDSSEEDDEQKEEETEQEEGLRFLALGDSYTIGASVPKEDRWPEQLVGKLEENGFSVADPEYVATSGWTTSNLIYAINNSELRDEYDMVSLLIGVNNQYQGVHIEVFEKEFPELLSMAIMLAGGDSSKVFVLSIPDYGVTPFAGDRGDAIGKAIDEYNFIKEEFCYDNGIDFYDITPISREAKDNLDLLASDRLHPSGLMYSRWVDFISEGVVEMLEE